MVVDSSMRCEKKWRVGGARSTISSTTKMDILCRAKQTKRGRGVDRGRDAETVDSGSVVS